MSDSRSKKCPHCSSVMKVETKLGVAIDVCVPCSVVWLDCGELEHICDSSAMVSQAMRQLLDSVTKTTSLSCPTCNDKNLSSATVVGASLSVCVGCQGLYWFRKKAIAKQREHDRNTPRMPSKENAQDGITTLDVVFHLVELLCSAF